MIGDKPYEYYKSYQLREVLGATYIYRDGRYVNSRRTNKAAKLWIDNEEIKDAEEAKKWQRGSVTPR